MKNKKGFTLVEVLAVIVILGILGTIAIGSISRYRKNVNEKEKISLRSSITSAFDNYRIENSVSKRKKINISDLKFTNLLTYNNNECDLDSEDIIAYIVKGEYLDKYLSEEDKVKYGVCMLTTEEENGKLVTKCASPITASKETTYCIKLVCNGQTVINDFEDENSICYGEQLN